MHAILIGGTYERAREKNLHCRIPYLQGGLLEENKTKLNPSQEDMESPCLSVSEEEATAIKSNHPSCCMDNGDHYT